MISSQIVSEGQLEILNQPHEKILEMFNPSKQSFYAQNSLDRCFSGNAPTLLQLNAKFGLEMGKNWLMIQLTDLFLFSGIKDQIQMSQIESISDTIIASYGFLKLTEVMVFFHMFKSGKYGSFFNRFDGITICAGLNEFLDYRKGMRSRHCNKNNNWGFEPKK